jgi:aspartate 1-decarboxylase
MFSIQGSEIRGLLKHSHQAGDLAGHQAHGRMTSQWRYRAGFTPASPSISRPCEGLPDASRIPIRRTDHSGNEGVMQDASGGNPTCLPLDAGAWGYFLAAMLRQVLKSKLHRAMITAADVDYEGSIEIPTDLMEAVDLWPGEKVLVASITTGNRLETYVLPSKPGTGQIMINGGAAHRIKAGERVAIMAFALTDKPLVSKNLLLDENNNIVRPAN